MKKLLLPLLFLPLAFSACNKGAEPVCDPVATVAPNSETLQVKAYLDNAGIADAVLDPRGFYYRINNPGGAEKPTVCDNVTVTYRGTFTTGTEFDGTAPGKTVSFSLNGVIVGWQEGVPLIGKGGNIDLYLPPSLAYGSQSRNGIPANSILIFNVGLVDF